MFEGMIEGWFRPCKLADFCVPDGGVDYRAARDIVNGDAKQIGEEIARNCQIFEAALRVMVEGQITEQPVLTRYGYHVIRMDALAPGQVLPFETVRPKIAQALEKAAWVRDTRAFVAKLVDAAQIQGANPAQHVADA